MSSGADTFDFESVFRDPAHALFVPGSHVFLDVEVDCFEVFAAEGGCEEETEGEEGEEMHGVSDDCGILGINGYIEFVRGTCCFFGEIIGII